MSTTVDQPRGFRPQKAEGQALRSTRYAKTSDEVVYEGDLVKRVAAGTVQAATVGGGNVVGVAASTSLATDADFVEVYDDPDMVFVCQADGATAYAVADNGLNADISLGAANTTLNRSGHEVDMSTAATTATLPIKILGLAPTLNGVANPAGAAADLLVKLNQVEKSAGVVGV